MTYNSFTNVVLIIEFEFDTFIKAHYLLHYKVYLTLTIQKRFSNFYFILLSLN